MSNVMELETKMQDLVIVEPEVKKKKGRPRKEQLPPTEIETEEPEKKKRGRKKKEVVEEVKPKKKRGRKAAVKYYSSSIRKKLPLTTIINENNDYILHLDIKNEAEIDSKMTKTNEDEYKANTIDYMFEELTKQIEDEDIQDVIDDDDLREKYKKRLDFRERQDKGLIDKLETLHKDELFINNLLIEKEEKLQIKEVNNEEKIQTVNRKKGYFQILYNFIQNKEWLHNTDVNCWWCCHTFETTPIGVPVHFNVKTRKFRVKGVFCSFACMCAYKDDQKIPNTNSLIRYMYKKLTSMTDCSDPIRAAPPRCTLKMFGGDLSIEEFRQSTNEHKMYKMVEYPMFISNEYIEEVDLANVKNANMKLFDDTSFEKVVKLDDKRVQDARQRLLQIEKSTVTTGNTIDKFLNFT